MPLEEVNASDEQLQEPQIQSPNGNSSANISEVQCNKSEGVHDMGTQTEWYTLLKHSTTQSDPLQLMDVATMTNDVASKCSVMTQTSQPLDDKCLSYHDANNYPDELAMAQSTIAWQSLMIKVLQIHANN